jgi:hypothetical protein
MGILGGGVRGRQGAGRAVSSTEQHAVAGLARVERKCTSSICGCARRRAAGHKVLASGLGGGWGLANQAGGTSGCIAGATTPPLTRDCLRPGACVWAGAEYNAWALSVLAWVRSVLILRSRCARSAGLPTMCLPKPKGPQDANSQNACGHGGMRCLAVAIQVSRCKN